MMMKDEFLSKCYDFLVESGKIEAPLNIAILDQFRSEVIDNSGFTSDLSKEYQDFIMSLDTLIEYVHEDGFIKGCKAVEMLK